MDIGFFIEYNNQVIQLPVNPEKVSVAYKGNNKSTEIIKLGEITLLKDRKLADISFESFFPQYDWFPAVRTRGDFRGPEFYKAFIQLIMDSKKPCRLVVTGINISMQCSIEKFDYYHKSGDHEDAYYSIGFKEYREYHITPIGVDPSMSSSKSYNSAVSGPAIPVSPKKITIGCTVILNGRVHLDSYGSKPGKLFTNYRGVVNLINSKGSAPYHITTPSGGWLGWATAESVVLA